MNSKLIIIALSAAIFGLAGGIAGSLIARAYILEKAFNLPILNDINLSGNAENGSGLTIRNAKKIVIEQNDKTAETLADAKRGIVGIFKKIDANKKEIKTAKSKNAQGVSLEQYYGLSDQLGQGIIVTSDGWILSTFLPDDYENTAATSAKASLIDAYVVISNDKKVYAISDLATDSLKKYAFWRINANDLPVKKFTDIKETKNGELAIAINWNGDSFLSAIARQGQASGKIKSSDFFSKELMLSANPSENFNGSFLFNLNGEIMAVIDNTGKIEHISGILPCLDCLFKKKAVSYPRLGVNYADLGEFVNPTDNKELKGALIYADQSGIAVQKGSAGEAAGLKAGDIILKINGNEINLYNSLSLEISRHSIGEEIIIEFSRDNIINTVKVRLR